MEAQSREEPPRDGSHSLVLQAPDMKLQRQQTDEEAT
jgi:hypothetical protein